jgi:hypothetical protein
MRLHGPERRIDLDIVSGPDAEDWCRVCVTIADPEGHWSATDSCLQGAEVQRLADWLHAIASGSSAARKIEFMEPELSFALVPGEPQLLRVFLRWNLRPAWVDDDSKEEFCQDYPVEAGQLRRAVASLRESLHRWKR